MIVVDYKRGAFLGGLRRIARMSFGGRNLVMRMTPEPGVVVMEAVVLRA